MKISIAVVAYNEAATLPALLSDLEGQDYPHEKLEVLLIDSGSSDQTPEIMADFAQNHRDFAAVQLLNNPNKTLPYGCNVALEAYTGDAIVRIDAHASIPADFISKNVRLLESGEMVCGGQRPNIIDDETPWKKTLLAAEQSMFGSSFAAYRSSQQRQAVSSIFHGMYRREVYDRVGPYDVRLARTEDNDMSYRIRQAGYTITYDPEIISYQHTRSSLKGMLRQKYLNGYWIGKTMGINSKCFSLFHFVPFCFVLGILGTTVLSAFGFPLLGQLMWGAYGLVLLGCLLMELKNGPFYWQKLLLPLLIFGLHVSYGIGTLVGLVEMPFWGKKLKRNVCHPD